MDTFKAHVIRSNSIIAAHAMLRALADRRTLGRRKDLLAYLGAVCGEHVEAKRIAERGMGIIADAHGGDVSTLGDEEASAYIKWLSDFVVKRAARGRVANPDRGRTLLFELRKTVPS